MFVYVVSVSCAFSGVGFSFIFAWILMGMVTALFVVGGNVEKLVCEPLANRQLYKVKNTSTLPESSYSLYSPFCISVCFCWQEFYLSSILVQNQQHCSSVLMNMRLCVCADHRHTVLSSSRQEELPSWDAVSESKH